MKKEGLLYMLIAAFAFSVSGASAKYLGKHLNAIELVFFRNLLGVGFILYSIKKRPLKQIGGRMPLLIFRGVIGSIALITYFNSIIKIGLAEAITYQQSYPIFLAILSAIFLREKITAVLPILLGFLGLCLIFVPQFNLDKTSALHHSIGLLNTLLTALAYLSIKGLSRYYENRAVVLSFMLSGIIIPVMVLLLKNAFPF